MIIRGGRTTLVMDEVHKANQELYLLSLSLNVHVLFNTFESHRSEAPS